MRRGERVVDMRRRVDGQDTLLKEWELEREWRGERMKVGRNIG